MKVQFLPLTTENWCKEGWGDGSRSHTESEKEFLVSSLSLNYCSPFCLNYSYLLCWELSWKFPGSSLKCLWYISNVIDNQMDAHVHKGQDWSFVNGFTDIPSAPPGTFCEQYGDSIVQQTQSWRMDFWLHHWLSMGVLAIYLFFMQHTAKQTFWR